jgi:hypothetical protein
MWITTDGYSVNRKEAIELLLREFQMLMLEKNESKKKQMDTKMAEIK